MPAAWGDSSDGILPFRRGGLLLDKLPLFQWHRVAEVCVTIGNPSTIEADKLRILCQGFDLFKFLIACQNAEMARMFSFAYLFRHGFLLSRSALKDNAGGTRSQRLFYTKCLHGAP